MRILVTGGGGLLGGALARRGLLAPTRAQLDVTDPVQRDRFLEEHQPDRVVFCAAVTGVDRCNSDPRAQAVNVGAPIAFARLLPTTLLSSNYVFGTDGPHSPGDPTSPVNAYGQQKVAAEQGVLAQGGDVIRTGWLYGRGGSNFPSTLASQLLSGRVQALDHWTVQPTWVEDLADVVLGLPSGITHAVGSVETTWAAFALAIAAEMGLGGRVEIVSELPLGPRPRDARLAPAVLPGWTDRIEKILSLA
jgi:dTDP-4-dehydrorhamnose reductase